MSYIMSNLRQYYEREKKTSSYITPYLSNSTQKNEYALKSSLHSLFFAPIVIFMFGRSIASLLFDSS